MTEAAIIAISAATQAVCAMVTEIIKGQPPDIKIKLWEWYVNDIAEMRKFFGMKV